MTGIKFIIHFWSKHWYIILYIHIHTESAVLLQEVYYLSYCIQREINSVIQVFFYSSSVQGPDFGFNLKIPIALVWTVLLYNYLIQIFNNTQNSCRMNQALGASYKLNNLTKLIQSHRSRVAFNLETYVLKDWGVNVPKLGELHYFERGLILVAYYNVPCFRSY